MFLGITQIFLAVTQIFLAVAQMLKRSHAISKIINNVTMSRVQCEEEVEGGGGVGWRKETRVTYVLQWLTDKSSLKRKFLRNWFRVGPLVGIWCATSLSTSTSAPRLTGVIFLFIIT